MGEPKTGIRMRYTLGRMQTIDMGRQGENLARTVEIDISNLLAIYPGATITLMVERPEDKTPYVAITTVEDNVLVWPITDADTAFSGSGRIEIRAAIGDVLAKSVMGSTRVSSSLIGSDAQPPDPAKPWVDRVLEAEASANASARDANEAAERAETAADILEGAAQAWPDISSEVDVLQQIASGTYKGTDLTVKFASEIAGYADPWAWIRARIRAEDFSGLYVCDYIPVTCTNGVKFNARIAGINTYKGYGNTAVGNHIDFISASVWPMAFKMNLANFNNGLDEDHPYPWLCSNGYHFINSLAGNVPNGTGNMPATEAVDYTAGGVYFFLPDSLKNVIVEKRILLPTRFSASGIQSKDNNWGWVNAGKLWFPSELEITGVPIWGDHGFGAGGFVQYPLFARNMNRVIGRYNWCTLSAPSDNTICFVFVGTYGLVSYTIATGDFRGPVCFRIA